MHIVKQVAENSNGHDLDMHILLSNFKQTFDKLSRSKMIQDLKGINNKEIVKNSKNDAIRYTSSSKDRT